MSVEWADWDKGIVEFNTHKTTGKEIAQETYDMNDDMWRWHKCNHENRMLVVRSLSGSRKVYQQQCIRCGHAGKNVNGEETDTPFDENLAAKHRKVKHDFEDRILERQAHLLTFIDSKEEYQEYRETDDWKDLVDRVMERCGGVCEGCGIKDAVDTHHITYDNRGEEFLFELQGLCRECHERWHESDERRKKNNARQDI